MDAVDFQLFFNGKPIEQFEIVNGYAVIKGCFAKEEFLIKYNIPAKFIHANPLVRADAGEVSIMKGPLVYCLEEVDNGSNLSSVYIDTNQDLIEKYDPDLFGGTNVVICKGDTVLFLGKPENWRNDYLGERNFVMYHSDGEFVRELVI